MSIPNEVVQGIVDIKTAIENKSAETPVVIPNREYPDELCEALGAVKDAIENSQGGGGNENSVETITATVLHPFGDMDADSASDLVYEVYNHNAEVYFSIDATSLNMGTLKFNAVAVPDPVMHDDAFVGLMCNFTQDSGNNYILQSAGRIIWIGNGLFNALMYESSQGVTINFTDLAGDLPCTTTIYRHPMPEE